jgi:hypothetical protein
MWVSKREQEDSDSNELVNGITNLNIENDCYENGTYTKESSSKSNDISFKSERSLINSNSSYKVIVVVILG